jgi:hypothetical protein
VHAAFVFWNLFCEAIHLVMFVHEHSKLGHIVYTVVRFGALHDFDFFGLHKH